MNAPLTALRLYLSFLFDFAPAVPEVIPRRTGSFLSAPTRSTTGAPTGMSRTSTQVEPRPALQPLHPQ